MSRCKSVVTEPIIALQAGLRTGKNEDLAPKMATSLITAVENACCIRPCDVTL